MEPDWLATFLDDHGPGAAYNVRIQKAVTQEGGNVVTDAMKLLNQEINENAQAAIQGCAGRAQALE